MPYDEYNFIGRKGNQCQAYWVIHGCPRGHKTNIKNVQEQAPFARYVNYHSAGDTHIEFPSKPGEKFIKEPAPDLGCFAYTFVRTGIYEYGSARAGSNYGAITIYMDEISDKNWEKLQPELKEWFERNILDFYTTGNKDGWLQWNCHAADTLFKGVYDKQLHDLMCDLLQPYLDNSVQKSDNDNKVDTLKDATQRLKQQMAELEKQEQEIKLKKQEIKRQLQQLNNSK